MTTTVLVVSDLHLGGPDGFQMCTPPGQARLAAFFRHAAALGAPGRSVHLVLAGDVVDFLAEPDDSRAAPKDWTWSAFVGDEGLALDKLERILGRTAPIWDALGAFVAGGGSLTLLLGNHDVELSLPRVRRRFLERLAAGGGQVTFLHDGEALALGELLVEHGNRYEGWNAVADEPLQRVRARLSRGQRPGPFAAQPGSELVARVMNPIKRTYGFVDLLKPETSAVLPILAVLDPGLWRRVRPVLAEAARAAWRQAHVPATGPLEESLAGAAGGAAEPWPDEPAFAAADDLAAQAVVEGFGEDLVLDLLLKAFRKRRDRDQTGFDVEREAEVYRLPAEGLAASGHRAVVFGHTHHAKRVRLAPDGEGATYLNTGTWADLMRLPESLYTGSDQQGREALRAFLAAVRANDLARYRRQVPTFAQVELDDGERLVSADVLFFDESGPPVPISTSGVLQRLDPPAP
jgi:UDP-2,3-diacylglucosamine pyrophosphatase LpxH